MHRKFLPSFRAIAILVALATLPACGAHPTPQTSYLCDFKVCSSNPTGCCPDQYLCTYNQTSAAGGLCTLYTATQDMAVPPGDGYQAQPDFALSSDCEWIGPQAAGVVGCGRSFAAGQASVQCPAGKYPCRTLPDAAKAGCAAVSGKYYVGASAAWGDPAQPTKSLSCQFITGTEPEMAVCGTPPTGSLSIVMPCMGFDRHVVCSKTGGEVMCPAGDIDRTMVGGAMGGILCC